MGNFAAADLTQWKVAIDNHIYIRTSIVVAQANGKKKIGKAGKNLIEIKNRRMSNRTKYI